MIKKGSSVSLSVRGRVATQKRKREEQQRDVSMNERREQCTGYFLGLVKPRTVPVYCYCSRLRCL